MDFNLSVSNINRIFLPDPGDIPGTSRGRTTGNSLGYPLDLSDISLEYIAKKILNKDLGRYMG
jgi:hypothetical protein